MRTSPAAGWFFLLLGVAALVVALIPGFAEQVAEWAGESGCGANNEGAGRCSTGMVRFFGVVVGVICLLGGGIAVARGRRDATTVHASTATITTPQGTRQVDPAALDALMDQMSRLTSAGTAPNGDPVERLRRLADLRDAGVVDQAEFERLKRGILGEL
jgi:hypothetical protein